MDLANKVAIVTGGSAGIGLAVAEKLAAAGAFVALVARTEAKLLRAVERIGKDRAAAFPLDVADFKALDALPGRVMERFGGLDILVNNAGLNHRGPVIDFSAKELADVITTNLTAPIYLTRVTMEHLRAGGCIVNVASLAGKVPVPHEAAYSASKAGLRAFTRSFREEMVGRNVRVSSVCPGPVDTEFFGDIESVPDLIFSQPMSSPGEVADAVMRCIVKGGDEVSIPAASGKLATFGYLFPSLMKVLRPPFERLGAARKKKYMAAKRG